MDRFPNEVIGIEPRDVDEVVADTLLLAAIPAPTFEERERAEAVARSLREANIPAEFDAAGNVVARLSGESAAGDVALVAHLDTVFPASTPLQPRRDGDRLLGPGIGDNTVALATLLWIARRLRQRPLRRGVLLAATVGEEGNGDLAGARAIASTCSVGLGIVLEGQMLGRVVHAGVGSRRFRIVFTAPGGHSWEDFGEPNAIHALVRCGERLTRVALPSDPKTTLSIGVIQGGRSVNTIADRAAMDVDVRSLSEDRLAEVETELRRVIHAVADEIGARADVETIGRRPAAGLSADHALVREAVAALRGVGVEAGVGSASTDANALLAAGIPTVCIGMTEGGNMHRLDEWISIESIPAGLAQLKALVESVTGAG